MRTLEKNTKLFILYVAIFLDKLPQHFKLLTSRTTFAPIKPVSRWLLLGSA